MGISVFGFTRHIYTLQNYIDLGKRERTNFQGKFTKCFLTTYLLAGGISKSAHRQFSVCVPNALYEYFAIKGASMLCERDASKLLTSIRETGFASTRRTLTRACSFRDLLKQILAERGTCEQIGSSSVERSRVAFPATMNVRIPFKTLDDLNADEGWKKRSSGSHHPHNHCAAMHVPTYTPAWYL